MSDYEPLDLARLYNAGLNLLPSWPATPIGRQQFRGIPFEIGDDADRCFIGFGDGLRADPLAIPIDRHARSVVMAHRLVEMRLREGIPVGETVADCIFHYQDGGEVRLPVRDRFEIGAPRTGLQDGSWGQFPFRALPEKPSLPPRYKGGFNGIGARQTEAVEATPVYFLWAWINPRPDVRLAGLTIVPMGPHFVLGGVTLGQIDEHPLAHPAARPVKISLIGQGPDPSRTGPDAGFAHSLASVDHTIPGNPTWRCDVAVEVDRGVATFPYPLSERSPEAYLGDAFAGWGEAVDDESHSVYVSIAAIPSATVTVAQKGEELGRARWQDIEAARVVESGRVRIEVVDPGRNWVRTTVVDDETGSPVPCRVHFRSPEGIPYQPHGHRDAPSRRGGPPGLPGEALPRGPRGDPSAHARTRHPALIVDHQVQPAPRHNQALRPRSRFMVQRASRRAGMRHQPLRWEALTGDLATDGHATWRWQQPCAAKRRLSLG